MDDVKKKILKIRYIYQTADILARKQHSFSRKMLMLELEAWGGMRIGEVLKWKPGDKEDRKPTVRAPIRGILGRQVILRR
jgi:hypothetical protein